MNRQPNWGVPSHSYPPPQPKSQIVGGLAAAAAVVITIAMPGTSNQGQVTEAVKQIDKPQVELTSRIYELPPAAGAVQNIDITPATETDVAQPLSYDVQVKPPPVYKSQGFSYPDLRNDSRIYRIPPVQTVDITPATETDVAQSLSTTDGPAITVTLGQNEIKGIRITDLGGTGGTFTLTFTNHLGVADTTGTIAYNADAATVQAALEALSNVAPGDVVVTDLGLSGGETLDQSVEFTGQYAREDQRNSGPNALVFATTPTGDNSCQVFNTQNGGVAAETDVAQPLSYTVEAPVTARVYKAYGAHTPQQFELGTRIFRAQVGTDAYSITPATETDVAQALSNSVDPDQSVGITTATETDVAQPLSYFVDTAAAPPPRVYRAPQAHSYPGQQPVSQSFNAFFPTLVPYPSGIALQGQTNTPGVVHPAVAFDRQEPKDPEPQVFVFFNTTPPIYGVITPGSTNQGFRVPGYEPQSAQQFQLGSRVYSRLAAGADIIVSITAATETDVAQALSYTVQSDQTASITAATETDVAQPLSVTDGPAQSISITTATETDTAIGLSYTVGGGVVSSPQRTLTGMGT